MAMFNYLIVVDEGYADCRIWESKDADEPGELEQRQAVIGTFMARTAEEAIEKAAANEELEEDILKAYQLAETVEEFMTFDEFFKKAEIIDAKGNLAKNGPDAVLERDQVTQMSKTMEDAGMEHYVYTLIAGEEDTWFIRQGFALANRIGFLIGRKSAELGDEIVYW